MKAELDVLHERMQQKTKWSDAHDDKHSSGELTMAAVAYLLGSERLYPFDNFVDVKNTNNRTKLVRAAALIIAEIDRGDRQLIVTARRANEVKSC